MIRSENLSCGDPAEPGRYLVFTRCASSQVSEFVEPTVAMWNNSRWGFYDAYHGTHEVIGWIGPLPAMRVDEIRRLSPSFKEERWLGGLPAAEGGGLTPDQEYDL